eukprot:1715648-Prymnesium_polylepis.1
MSHDAHVTCTHLGHHGDQHVEQQRHSEQEVEEGVTGGREGVSQSVCAGATDLGDGTQRTAHTKDGTHKGRHTQRTAHTKDGTHKGRHTHKGALQPRLLYVVVG